MRKTSKDPNAAVTKDMMNSGITKKKKKLALDSLIGNVELTVPNPNRYDKA